MLEPFQGSAEFRLFCLALGRSGEPAHLARLRAAIGRCRNWKVVLAGARRHRVDPLLLKGLRNAQSADVPKDFLDALKKEAIAAAAESLAQAGEVVRLSGLFRKADVPLIALKGVVLSAQLYGNPALRHPRDVDLLVAESDLVRAGQILIEAGYRRSGPHVEKGQEEAYWRWSKEAKFVAPESGILIELHHRLTDNPLLLPCDFARLWRERDEVEMGGTKVAALPRAFLPLYLCAHGASHAWQRLCWLTDFTAALDTEDAVRGAIARADELGLGLAMGEGLLLARDWLGLPIPGDCLSRSRSSAKVRRLAQIAARSYGPQKWHRTPRRGSFSGFFLYSVWLRLHAYLLMSGWRYRKHQLARELVAPSDWEAFRLPSQLTWLYPVIRPFGWLVRRLRGMA